MERQVVALAKGDGFQEVLVALDASADTEYPVVESTGGVWGLGGSLSPWGMARKSLTLWWPFCAPSVSPECPLDIPMPCPYHAHAVPMGCSCAVLILLLGCPSIFPGRAVPVAVHVLSPRYCHGATSVFPYCPHGVPVLYLCCPHPLWCPHAVPSTFPFCLHGAPMGRPLDIPVLSSHRHPACPYGMSPCCPQSLPLLFPYCPLGVPLVFPCCPHTAPTLQGPPRWWAPSAGPSWSPSSRATSTLRPPKGRR